MAAELVGCCSHTRIGMALTPFGPGRQALPRRQDASADGLFQPANILASNLGRSQDHTSGSGRRLAWLREEVLASYVDI